MEGEQDGIVLMTKRFKSAQERPQMHLARDEPDGERYLPRFQPGSYQRP